MIDLSHLSEEEQHAIMTVLKRDAELKKAEEERIRQLQKVVSDEESRKYMSGEWFYKVKSQRHQDKIHGSDIIMASMKQRKPSVVEYLTKSWGGRSRSVSTKNGDGVMASPKPVVVTDSQERKTKENGGIPSIQQEKVSLTMRSPKNRHNPFNTVPIQLDFEENDIHVYNVVGPTKSLDKISRLPEANTGVHNLNDKQQCQKPVPKKRTKIYKPQSSVSDTIEQSSTMRNSSTIKKDIHILQHRSNEPVIKKNQIPVEDNSEHVLENKKDSKSKRQGQDPLQSPLPMKLPKSRLPVRVSLQQTFPVHLSQEKPKIQPRHSLSTVSNVDDVKKEKELVKKDQEERVYQFNSGSQVYSGQDIKTLHPSHPSLTIISEKPLNNNALQQSVQNEVKKHCMTASSAVQPITATEDLKKIAVDQVSAELNIQDTSERTDIPTVCETDNSTLVFSIQQEFQADVSTVAGRDDEHFTPTDDHEGSIAKVLEWFSRSSDSSDRLDLDSSEVDMEMDANIDDIDFDQRIDQRPTTRSNVYLIMPRQTDEYSVDSTFVKQKRHKIWENEESTDNSLHDVPLELRSFSTCIESSTTKPSNDSNVTVEIPELNDSPITKVKNELEKNSREEQTKVKPKSIIFCSKESTAKDEQPKIANLKHFWEKENNGPKILISRSYASILNEPVLITDLSRHSAEDVREPSAEPCMIVQSPEHHRHEEKRFEEDLALNVAGCTNTIHKKHISKLPEISIDTDSSLKFPNQMKNLKTENTLAFSPPQLLNSGFKLTEQNLVATVSLSKSNADLTSPIKTEENSRTLQRAPIKQNLQQESMAEKIKHLKSFWEKETWEPRKSGPPQHRSMMNKRFTKSEFDLRTLGTEFDDDANELTSTKNRLYSLQKDRPTVTDGISMVQFKNLKDFWGKSPSTKQSGQNTPVLDDGSLKSPKAYKNQGEHANNRAFHESQNTRTSVVSSPAKMKAFQSPSKRRITSRQHSGSKNDQTEEVSRETVVLSHSPQLHRSPQTSLKDTLDLKTKVGVGQTSQQSGLSSKGSLTGKPNSMRRACSMFSVYTADENQSLDVHFQPFSTPISHQVKKQPGQLTRKTQESPCTLPKMSPETTQKRLVRPCEDSDSQPLARSFIPRDYHHYLGITENKTMYSPPPVTEQVDDFICTSFTTSPETNRSCKCSPVSTNTPVQECLETKIKSSGRTFFPQNEVSCYEASQTSTAQTKGKSSCDEDNPIQKALRRATSRPVYHKSMEDINTPPRQDQNLNPTDNFMQVSTDLPQTSFATSDSEHLKQLSKSVPSLLQKESDGAESDSESSSRCGVPQWSDQPFTHFRNYSGSTSLSSVSGSVASVYNSDYSSVEVQGYIQFSLNYVQRLREFHIFVVQCQNLAAVDVKRNRSDPYVKSYLIPDSANLGKRKTAVKKKTLHPAYKEILRYRVRLEYLKSQVLNLSVWHNDTFGRNSFLGETEVDLSSWDLNDTDRKLVPLRPRNLLNQFATRLQSSDLRGQIKLAIRFLPQISNAKNIPGSGEVHIWVKDCKNLPLIRTPTIDPYVKCFVLPDTSKKSRQKTRVLKRTTNPIFNHTMVYDGFQTEDLKEACVELTVWDRDHLANHPLGGLRLGMGTGMSYGVKVDWMDSTAEEAALWKRMMESPNEWVEGMFPLREIKTKNIRK